MAAARFLMTMIAYWGAGAFVSLGAARTPAQIPQFKIENPGVGDLACMVGFSVAMDGTTLVVGAPSADNYPAPASARVYVSDGMGWVLEAELKASDMEVNDFGESVSISGNTVVVGAPARLGRALPGSAYVFTRNGSTWTQQAKLVAADCAAKDYFGAAVSISGDTVVVGAYGHDGTSDNCGAAYVFTRADSSWTQQAKLSAPDAGSGHQFGSSVAMAGNTIVVGAGAYHWLVGGAGSAYIFVGNGSSWIQEAKLTAADSVAGDRFADSVAIKGDTIVIGAHDQGGTSACAFVYTRSNGVWSQESKLSDPEATGYVCSVAVGVDTAVMGTGGFVYIFTRNGSVWSRQARLTGLSPKTINTFGFSVALAGDLVAIGAHGEDDDSTLYGAAYVFARNGSDWTRQARISVNAAEKDEFGSAVSISGDAAIVGAPGDRFGRGAAFVYTYKDSDWKLEAKLIPDPVDHIGYSVAISSDTAVVGAPWDDANGLRSGSVYVFKREDGVWTQEAKLIASDGAAEDNFGFSVSVWGDTVIVGASGKDGDTGAAYVFTRSGGMWTEQAKLSPPDPEVGERCGAKVHISGETVIIGAPNVGYYYDGAAYIYTREGSSWGLEAVLFVPYSSYFGKDVSISGNTAVIGTENGSVDAYVFTRSGKKWSEQAKLIIPEEYNNWTSGISVSVSGDAAVVGIYDLIDSTSPGLAYLFSRNGSTWSEGTKLTASDAAAKDEFGVCAIDGRWALVGAYGKDDPEVDSGAVYMFDLRSVDLRNAAGPAWTMFE